MPLRYLFISVTLTVILVIQPLLPYIEYFTFRKYIIEHLCVNRDVPGSTCHGKCFLHRSLKEENQQNQNGNKAPVKTKTEIIVYTLPENDFLSEEWHEISTPECHYTNFYTFIYSTVIFRPPRIS